VNNTLTKQWNSPVLSSLLENRLERGVLFCAGLAHLGFSLAGFPLWKCPILMATGIPCPGCGLTRAILELLHGNLGSSLQTHLFAPLFVLVIGLFFAVLIFPGKPGKTLVSMIRSLETHTGITSILLVLFMLYWVIRIVGLIPFPNKF
jgi:hypothetical protein